MDYVPRPITVAIGGITTGMVLRTVWTVIARHALLRFVIMGLTMMETGLQIAMTLIARLIMMGMDALPPRVEMTVMIQIPTLTPGYLRSAVMVLTITATGLLTAKTLIARLMRSAMMVLTMTAMGL